MCLVVDLGEVLEVQMGVDLGGADVRVAQQFLHRPEVAGGLQQMAGEGVADAGPGGNLFPAPSG